MKYEVQVVDDHELPAGVKRVLVERTEDAPLLILAESVAGNWRFVQGWEDSHQESAPVFALRPAG